MIRLRQKLLPLADVKKALQLGTDDPANGFVVVTQAGGQLFGAIVDNVFHTEEIVIKPMTPVPLAGPEISRVLGTRPLDWTAYRRDRLCTSPMRGMNAEVR